MIDTPPVAGTPDNGSDFYNTPVGDVTPATKPSDSTVPAPATEPVPTSEPAPVIPGLGLVSPTDQPTNEPAKQVPEVTLADQGGDVSMETAATHTEPLQERSSEAQNHKDSAATSEAMDVDEKHEQTTTENADGTSTAQEENERQGEEGEEGEHPEWEVDSDPYESSSNSSSSDSDDSDDEDYPILSPEEQARILMLAEGGSDDEGDGKGKNGGFIRSANEVVEDVLPIPEVEITPDMKVVLLGKIQTVIGNAVLIEANTSGEYQVLESGSLLCSENREVIGVVGETLGRVENPLYTVMYSTAEEAQKRGITKDMPVYYVESQSTFVFTQPLKGLKGSDASNFHDEEVAEDEIEFSDDEAEAEYKKRLKQKRQERKEARGGGPGKFKRETPGPSKLSQTELNYDDEGGEEGYTPLARPKNLHEMMGAREAPIEGNERGPGFRGDRGRGRGNDRGRGGRGRGGRGRGGSYERDQDRRPHQQSGTSNYRQPAAAPQTQPSGYGQPAYPPQQPQQPVYGMPQPFAYPQYAPQQGQYPQAQAPTQFPFQFPFQPQAIPQQAPFQSIPQGAHINPQFFLAALQQQQLQQQQQYQQPQQAPAQGQAQNPAMNFDQVKAQLDLLRNLSNQNQNQNQGPPPS
jgi:H/ACA ribonucleoprotein complex non-core subunit NAF1